MKQRDNLPLIGVLTISAVTISLELLHTRLLSILCWNHIVYLIVTVAMLGFGISGAILALWKWPMRLPIGRLLAVLSLAFAITIVASMVLACRVSINIEHSLRSYLELAKIAFCYTVLVLPYLLAGAIVAIAITRFGQAIATVYFFNMVGSALGCFLFLCLIGPVGGETLLFILASLSTVAAFFFNRLHRDSLSFVAYIVLVIILAAGAGWGTRLIELKPERHKELANVYRFPQARVEYSKWNDISRVDVSSCPGIDLRMGRPIHQDCKMVTVDGTANTLMVRISPGPLRQASKYNINCLAYALVSDPEVLVIGVGAGPDIVWGLERGAKRITGVDINPTILDIGKRLFRDFNGDIFNRENVEIIESEGRNYVRATPESFDIIQITGVDTFAALSSGAYILSENYLYTTEAVEDYLQKLKPDGILSICRWRYDEPRECLRLCSLGISALTRMGITNPEKHMAVLGVPNWGSVMFKKSPFTEDDLKILTDPSKVDKIQLLFPSTSRPNPYAELFGSWKKGELLSFFKKYPYKISPVYDDRPFFFEYSKWKNALKMRGEKLPIQDIIRGNWAFFILLALLFQVALAVAIFIIIPLLKFRRDGLAVRGSSYFIPYFTALGIGFMFIEISLMQKFVLFLGHPIYSIAVVMASVLFFSGLGSLASGFVRIPKTLLIAIAALGISIIFLGYSIYLEDLFRIFAGSSIFPKVVFSLLLIGPPAFLMGMPFPSGLTILKQRAEYESLIPWAWGINAGASILGSILSIILAVEMGFSRVMMLAAVVYLLGTLILLSGKARGRLLPPISLEQARNP